MTETLDIPAPLELYTTAVKPEWIDHNGHMNLACYPLAFYEATNALSEYLGLTREFKARTKTASFAANMHLAYRREVTENAVLSFQSRIIDCDSKRVHFWHEMHVPSQHYLAATCEMLSLNIDTTARRVADMLPEALERIQQVRDAHAALPPPPGLGLVIQLNAPLKNA